MITVLRDNKQMTDKYNTLVDAFESIDLPNNIRLWVTEPDLFGYVLVEATISTKIIGLNITLDLLHTQLCLFDFETPEEVNDKAGSLAEEARHKYTQMFTAPEDKRQ